MHGARYVLCVCVCVHTCVHAYVPVCAHVLDRFCIPSFLMQQDCRAAHNGSAINVLSLVESSKEHWQRFYETNVFSGLVHYRPNCLIPFIVGVL